MATDASEFAQMSPFNAQFEKRCIHWVQVFGCACAYCNPDWQLNCITCCKLLLLCSQLSYYLLPHLNELSLRKTLAVIFVFVSSSCRSINELYDPNQSLSILPCSFLRCLVSEGGHSAPSALSKCIKHCVSAVKLFLALTVDCPLVIATKQNIIPEALH